VRVQSLREVAAQAPADLDLWDTEVVLERTFPAREGQPSSAETSPRVER
jgi:hypothetical protein